MTIEAATSIASLNPSYPTYQDSKKEGDDHIRLLKSVLQAVFPALGGVLGRTVAKTANFTPSNSTENGVIFACTGDFSCTLPTSISNGFGFWLRIVDGSAVALLDSGGTLQTQFVSGDLVRVNYDGSAWAWDIVNLRESPGTLVETPLSLSAFQYVVMHGGTIGSGSSGATFTGGRYKRLYALLWAVGGLAILDSGGGASVRGADWLTDWTSNKRITLPDGRGRVIAGVDASAGRLSAYVNGALLAAGGSEYLMGHTHTSTVASALTGHNHTIALTGTFGSTSSDGAHVHAVSITSAAEGQEHVHLVNLLSGNENAEHTHGGVPPTNFGASGFSAGSTLAGASGGTVSTGAQQANHQHAVYGNTEGRSATHTHLVSGNTVSAGGAHTHNTTVTFNSSTGNTDSAHTHTLTIDSTGAGNQGNLPPILVLNRYMRL